MKILALLILVACGSPVVNSVAMEEKPATPPAKTENPPAKTEKKEDKKEETPQPVNPCLNHACAGSY